MRSWRAVFFFFGVLTLQSLIIFWSATGSERDYLGEKLRARVAQQLPKEVRLEIGDITSLVPIPKNADLLLVSPNPPLGAISFSATWLERGFFRSTHGTALVQAYAPVAVAHAAIRPGDSLGPDNIAFEERELSPYAQSGYFLGFESLRHVRARGFSRPGMIIGAANTEQPLPVHQGEMVELVRLRGSLRIAAQVRALENGKLDQMIRVQNPSTNRILLARVSGPGELQLRAP